MHYRLVVEAQIANQTVVNVLHYEAETGNEQNIVTCFNSDIVPLYTAWMSNDCVISRLVCTAIEGGTQFQAVISGAGVIAQDSAPTQIAAVLSWKTAYIGRTHRGRTYVFGIPQAYIVNETFSATLTNALVDLADAMMSLTLPVGAAVLQVYSRKDLHFHPVTSYVIRDVPYTQRRRTIGRGT